MSDVIWAAAIAGGVGLLGNVPTYLVAKRNADINLSIAAQQARVELAKVQAENERLREQHREAERRNRQGTYHRLLAVLDRFTEFARGGPLPTEEQFTDTLNEAQYLLGGVLLFGSREVADAAREAMAGILAVELLAADEEGSFGERWQKAFRPNYQKVIATQSNLIGAMRQDIALPGGAEPGDRTSDAALEPGDDAATTSG